MNIFQISQKTLLFINIQQYLVKIVLHQTLNMLQQLTDHNNHLNPIQIRFALTGHTSHFDNIISIQHLKDQLQKQYKIEQSNQKMIAKNGYIVVGDQKIQNSEKFKKSFSSKVQQSRKMQKYRCIYLYDHRELLHKANQDYFDNIISEQQAKKLLISRKQTDAGLRTNIFELKYNQNTFFENYQQKLINYSPTIKQMLDNWHILLIDYLNNYEAFKGIVCFMGEYLSRWENQRKSCHQLLKALVKLNDDKISQINTLDNKIKALKLSKQQNNDPSSNTANNIIEKTRKNIENQIKNNRKSIDTFKKQIKSFYTQNDDYIKGYDQYCKKKKNQLESMSQQLIKIYTSLSQAAKQYLQRGQQTKILDQLQKKHINDKIFHKYTQQCSNCIDSIQNRFIELYKLYEKSGLQVKKSYIKFLQLQNIEQNMIQKKFIAIDKQIEKKQQLSQYRPKNIQTLQKQQKNRRIIFNKKLLAIHQELRYFLKQQQKFRKDFIKQMQSDNLTPKNSLLQNTNIPCFILNHDQTTDQQLTSLSSSSQQYLYNIDFYRPITGIQKILKQLDQLKTYQYNLKKQESVSSKIKNLKYLLQKSSNIFHFTYLQKSKQQQKKYESNLKILNGRVMVLEKQVCQLNNRNNQVSRQYEGCRENNGKLMIEIDQLNKEIKQLNKEIRQLKQLGQLKQYKNNKAQQQQYNEINKQIPTQHKQEQNILRITQLENQLKQTKTRYRQLQNTNKQLSNKVVEQLGLLEPIVCQLQKQKQKVDQLSQLVIQYKEVMGDQEIKITKLQAIIQNNLNSNLNNNSNNYQQTINLQNNNNININNQDQMNICFYAQNKAILTTNNVQDNDIALLKQQISELQAQKQELQQQNQQINQELMKIMMKDTEDIETQTHLQHKTTEDAIQNSKIINISMQENVQVAQTRIFIPFTNGTYIIANPSQPQQLQTNYMTTKQLGQSISKPYLLDLNCLSSKARQLLTECSLVVVAQITNILPASDKIYVQAKIQSALGFQDDEYMLRDYTKYLY